MPTKGLASGLIVVISKTIVNAVFTRGKKNRNYEFDSHISQKYCPLEIKSTNNLKCTDLLYLFIIPK